MLKELANLDLANINYLLFLNYRRPPSVEITLTMQFAFLRFKCNKSIIWCTNKNSCSEFTKLKVHRVNAVNVQLFI